MYIVERYRTIERDALSISMTLKFFSPHKMYYYNVLSIETIVQNYEIPKTCMGKVGRQVEYVPQCPPINLSVEEPRDLTSTNDWQMSCVFMFCLKQCKVLC